MEENLCSASSGAGAVRSVSCFSKESLVEIARAAGVPGAEALSKPRLHAALRRRLAPMSRSERDWADLPSLSPEARRRLRLSFSPPMPESWSGQPAKWLSNFDIHASVEADYAGLPGYRFLGVVPMDFEARVPEGGPGGWGRGRPGSGAGRGRGECVSDLCGVRMRGLVAEGVKAFSLVLNTDVHTGPGQHWVALHAIVDPGDHRYGFYYFDSAGKPPTREVDRFVSRAAGELVRAYPAAGPPDYAYSDVRHQRGNTECGVYCLAFLNSMLRRGSEFREVVTGVVGDAEMNSLRGAYFDEKASARPAKPGRAARAGGPARSRGRRSGTGA